jgi:hypothetical protein
MRYNSSRWGTITLRQDRSAVLLGGTDMTTILIIVAIAAVIYIYAAVAFHYGFKNWYPVCGCKGSVCSLKKPS